MTVQVQTGHPDVHGVWFNRGVFASQAYAERFGNKPPDQVPNNAAWQWLSRGLEEALLAFIGQAADASWELHGAFYEFQHPAILVRSRWRPVRAPPSVWWWTGTTRRTAPR